MIELIEKVTAADGAVASDSVTLRFEQRQKGRQRIRLDSGVEAAVVLPPGSTLDDGDLLRAADGFCVIVRAADEEVSTARTDDNLRMARACYHLGNRHVSLQVGDGWVRYQPDHVLDDMVRGLGLSVVRESAPFSPESGAYRQTAPQRHDPGHHHDHGHTH